ncbi:hypothetical protein C8E08_0617 [Paracidovorax citrulli]|nr:hypothetical protein C8E08_0617 [Paracidovorax citrulli]REG67692.1 hypothetical protein C8E07_0770 [Paracidovorax citrulli]RLJ92252.1 hypothetical protein C8E06_0771 [Paracidovorax citrulli]
MLIWISRLLITLSQMVVWERGLINPILVTKLLGKGRVELEGIFLWITFLQRGKDAKN